MSTVTLPPGPRARLFRGLLPEFRRDPLELVTRVAREYGDIARIPLGPIDFYLLSHPDLIEQVLVTQHRLFVKGRGLEVTGRVLGNGLLSSEGEFWRRQRRLAQPAFHRQRIQAYGETMNALTQRLLSTWRHGDELDVHRAMMRLTLAIATKTLFNADVETDADVVGDALAITLQQFERRTRTLIQIPESWPTPTNLRFERAARQLDAVIYRIIRERRESGEDAGDLLSMLMQAQDEDGGRMTPQQLRDEIMTMFLAGHETTAVHLSWTWHLLSQHPEACAQLHAELDAVLAGHPPAVADLPRLPFTQAVLAESLRLYPPAWMMGRKSTAPFTLGDYRFPTGTQIIASPWVVHRDGRWFAAPDEFRPQRWLDGLAQRLPAFAYFPFGGGQRLCIGKAFAQMEAALLLATIAGRFHLYEVPGQTIDTLPLLTLRPRHGLRVRLAARR